MTPDEIRAALERAESTMLEYTATEPIQGPLDDVVALARALLEAMEHLRVETELFEQAAADNEHTHRELLAEREKSAAWERLCRAAEADRDVAMDHAAKVEAAARAYMAAETRWGAHLRQYSADCAPGRDLEAARDAARRALLDARDGKEDPSV